MTSLGMPRRRRTMDDDAAAINTGLESLKYVEIETSRFCNRICSWCPNGHSGARRTQQLMEWSIFHRAISELGESGFKGFIALHNYNEPLANPRLHDELSCIQTCTPSARPAIYTNGDLIRVGTITRLLGLGVSYLRVTRYPKRPDVSPDYEILRRWLARVGVLERFAWNFTPVRQGLAARWEDSASATLIEVIRPSIRTYNDRGRTAVVPSLPRPRTVPCHMTATSLSIDYRGVVKMCCNVIPDSSASHKRYEVGDIAVSTLTELWNRPVMREWRIRHAAADWSASPA